MSDKYTPKNMAEVDFLCQAAGIHLGGAKTLLTSDVRRRIAQDAVTTMSTTANNGIPAFLTTYIDPKIFEILFSPTKAAEILGEQQQGSWTDKTWIFPMVENVGEVAAYGDFSMNGESGFNSSFPQRQSFLFQTITQWGELELDVQGLAKIDAANQKSAASIMTLNRYQNLTWFYGVSGLQNYGLLNDPSLSASLTPANKAAGGVKWINAGAVVATANEQFTDIQSVFNQLVAQSGGLIEQTSPLKLCMTPALSVALTTTNIYNVNVVDLLKKNFPNLEIVTAVQYSQDSTGAPAAGGELMQMIAPNVEGQQTGMCAYNEKLRAHTVVVGNSGFSQKRTAGSWGAVIRQPFAIASMIGM